MANGETAARGACEAVRESLEAYSLDALEPEESARLQHHLEVCPPCAEEASQVAAVTALLGREVPQVEPSPSLRARILAMAAEHPSQDPASPARTFFPPQPLPRPMSEDGPVRRADGTPRGRLAWLRRLPLSALAAGVAVASLAWAGTLQAQLNAQQAGMERLVQRSERYERIVAVLRSPQLRVSEMSGTPDAPSAEGRLMVDPSSMSGMLVVQNLPPVPRGRAYQLWYVSDAGRKSGGVVRPDDYGNGYFFVEAPADLAPYHGVGMTEEPIAGSAGPTGRRVLGGAL